jgi:hypothetical protein
MIHFTLDYYYLKIQESQLIVVPGANRAIEYEWDSSDKDFSLSYKGSPSRYLQAGIAQTLGK